MSEHAEHSAHMHVEPGGKPHPGPKTYAIVAIILTVVTALEVWVFYIEALRPLLVPILAVLSAGKFALVAMFYMHLRYDNPVYVRFLMGGMVIAFGVMLWLLALFTYSHPIGSTGH